MALSGGSWLSIWEPSGRSQKRVPEGGDLDGLIPFGSGISVEKLQVFSLSVGLDLPASIRQKL